MATQTNVVQEFSVENKSLKAAINSLIIEKENEKILENLKICIEHLTTFSVSEVDKELLQWIMPVFKTILQKIYDDNNLLSDTAGDDFVIDILKTNLQMASDFLTILRTIFEYLLGSDEINLNVIPSATTVPARVILSTFEHCRNSSLSYKQNFKDELLQIFNITQQIHTLFIKLFDSCILLENIQNNPIEIHILQEVLDTICDISNSLSDLNFKSLVMNWKAYASVIQKLSGIATDHIDLRKPILCLTTDVSKNLSLIISTEMDYDTKINIIKRTGLLIKFALRILDIFWDVLETLRDELFNLCCLIFSFPTECYLSKENQDITTSVQDNIYIVIEPFVDKLIEENKIDHMIITNQSAWLNKHYIGALNFFNACLGRLATKQSSIGINLADIVGIIFACTKKCFTEFIFMNDFFANVVINISACLILHQQHYERIEIILFENLLQEDIWCALLAMDIWSLILKHSTEQSSERVFMNLLQKYHELNFGINTHRLEDTYLKCFIQRVFQSFPSPVKAQLSQNFEENDWKITGLQNISAPQRTLIEQISSRTVERVQELGTNELNITNFVSTMENLEMLSTLDFQRNNVNAKNVVETVEILWEFDNTDLRNGVFKYFFNILCKITRSLITEFSNKQLFKILSRLKTLVCENSYKLPILDVLSELCNKNPNEFGQEGHKVSSLVSSILHHCLTANSNNLIKQNALEIVEKCSRNGKEIIVRDLANSSGKTREDISNYLQKRNSIGALDRTYFIALEKLEYSHKCVRWKIVTDDEPAPKRMKLVKEIPKKALRVREEHKISFPKAVDTVDVAQNADNVHEAITNIKSEVKCLMNVLKTEKLTAKNVSDLKIIANQLLSLM